MSITEQRAMRVDARAGDQPLKLSLSDLSVRDNFATAYSYGAVMRTLAESAGRVVEELMVDLVVDLGMRSRHSS
jgi:hypothetical protein